MKKTQQTDLTSPSSDFARLLSEPAGSPDSRNEHSTATNSSFYFQNLLSYIRPLRLRPNCLLTRHPLVFASTKTHPLPERIALNWLCRQLKNHGYSVQSVNLKNLEKPLQLESGLGGAHLWVWASEKEVAKKALTDQNLKVLSVTRWQNPALSLSSTSDHEPLELRVTWKDPIGLLHQALGICKSLAEQDFQCCDK